MRTLAFIPAFAALLASPAFGWTCPAQGGPEWREYKTAHFLLDTDMSRSKVEGLIKSLETMRGLVLNGLFNEDVDLPGHVRVVAPSSPSDFTALAGSSNVGAYFKMSWQDESLIVMPVVGSRASDELVAHELAHLLSHYQFPEQPTWFGEGLAAFFQTVAKREEQRRDASSQFSHIVRGGSTHGASVGVMPTDFMYAFSDNQQVAPVRELLEWRGAQSTGSAARSTCPVGCCTTGSGTSAANSSPRIRSASQTETIRTRPGGRRSPSTIPPGRRRWPASTTRFRPTPSQRGTGSTK